MYILLVIDVCTRFVFLRPILDKSAEQVAGELFSLFCLVGFPNILQSDNGSKFKNKVLRVLAQKAHVKHQFITPYHPHANGVAEWFVATAKLTISKYVQGDVSTWDRYLPSVQYAMNTKVAALHNSTPFSLFFGHQLCSAGEPNIQSALMSEEDLLKHVDYLTQIVFLVISEGAQAWQKLLEEKYVKVVKSNPFPDGSYVYVRDPRISGSLHSDWDGPFKVVHCTKGGSYTFEDLVK